ncbi:MAG: FAS1-like dehydratase domain-containing protein [Gulosibacter sp.]|uniref:FAS1-like dehydratase domain-containing protein n=1 Tax=Gulosibacter sp. TaxID=2817531 RepID=UPI003F8E227E
MSNAPDDLDAWIGRTESVVDIADRRTAAALAATLDHPDTVTEDSTLFPLGHWLHFTPTAPTSELGVDGHPKLGEFMPPLDLPRRMWAGSALEFHEPLRVGQQLERTTTIESITPKTGVSGRLCFVVLRHDISADGAHAMTERQTIVYREAVEVPADAPSAKRPPRPAGAAPEGWDWVQPRISPEITLFRYSALTFNSHRIHYDLDYVTSVEGYPGLVVHGPLSATYLVDGFLRTHPNVQLNTFEFSARAPIFANEQVHVVGRAEGPGRESLAIIGPDGKTSISASIQYS